MVKSAQTRKNLKTKKYLGIKKDKTFTALSTGELDM